MSIYANRIDLTEEEFEDLPPQPSLRPERPASHSLADTVLWPAVIVGSAVLLAGGLVLLQYVMLTFWFDCCATEYPLGTAWALACVAGTIVAGLFAIVGAWRRK